MADERRAALEDLILLRVPVRNGAEALKGFPWDSDSELFVLTRQDCRRVVTTYLEDNLSADDCQEWASTLEVRDDVGLEDGFGDLLKDFLFEIATPEITRRLTRSTATEWAARLA